jgi:hypothetical protein
MNYKTTGYSFSHSPNALAFEGLKQFQAVASPKLSPLSFSPLSAQQVFDDNSDIVNSDTTGASIAQGIAGLAKEARSAWDSNRASEAEVEKETRKHLRDLQLEKVKSDRTANYRQLQEDYLRSRISKTDKEMNDRLDNVGVPKGKRSIVNPSIIQGKPPEGMDMTKPFEQGDGENEEENLPEDYMDVSKPISEMPPVEPELPIDENLPDLVPPPEGQETSMLQGIKVPPVFKMDDFEVSYQPGSLTAQAGGVPSPASVALTDNLKSLDLSKIPVSVSFVSPAQEQELYNLGTGVSEIVNDADVQQKAQELFDMKAIKAADTQAPAKPEAAPSVEEPPPGGYFWQYKDAWNAHKVQLPGYKKSKIITHTSPEGYPFYEVQPPEPIEETAEERMAKQKGTEGRSGKTLLAEQTKILTSIGKVGADLDQIEAEITTIKDRGPIMGILRSANPYDVVAQRIEALVNGLVPTVARSIFGEVGVLTDQDIAHYKKILPNMRTQPELANLLIADLRRKLDTARATNLDVFQKSGYDVSQFENMPLPSVDIQRQISDTYDQLMKAPKNSPEYQSLYAKLRDLRREQRKIQRIATP